MSKMTKIRVNSTRRKVLFIWCLKGQYVKMKESVSVKMKGQYAKMKDAVLWLNMMTSI